MERNGLDTADFTICRCPRIVSGKLLNDVPIRLRHNWAVLVLGLTMLLSTEGWLQRDSVSSSSLAVVFLILGAELVVLVGCSHGR